MAKNPYRVGDAVYVPDGENYLRRRVVGTTRHTVLVAPYADSGYAVRHRWRRVHRALPPVLLTDADWAALEAELSDSPSGGPAS